MKRFDLSNIPETNRFSATPGFQCAHSPYQVPDKYYERFRRKGFDEKVSRPFTECARTLMTTWDACLKILDDRGWLKVRSSCFLPTMAAPPGSIYNAGMPAGRPVYMKAAVEFPLFVRWPAWRDGHLIS
ncbi:MAG: hypothetical protein R3C49_24845 [Planctomycetaceae bacterium]